MMMIRFVPNHDIQIYIQGVIFDSGQIIDNASGSGLPNEAKMRIASFPHHLRLEPLLIIPIRRVFLATTIIDQWEAEADEDLRVVSAGVKGSVFLKNCRTGKLVF
jgi:hypothetical protein